MNISLDDVSDYLESFHKYDGYAMACCVFHDDHSPSMRITNRGYYCQSCEASGSLEKLYSHLSGRPIQTHKKEYNPSAFIWDKWLDKYGSIKCACDVGHDQLTSRPDLGNYLYKRKLSIDQIKLGYIGFLSGYYIFPIHDENKKIQGAVARASPTIQTKDVRYSASKNCPVKIYVPDWAFVQNAEEIYVCFGTLDSWSLHMSGYAAVTGISGQQFRVESLDGFRKPIYIIADKKEQRSAIRLQTQLGWRGRRLDLLWPNGCKDPSDVHVNYGIDTLRDLIEAEKVKYNYD